jgi:hypothetical protein
MSLQPGKKRSAYKQERADGGKEGYAQGIPCRARHCGWGLVSRIFELMYREGVGQNRKYHKPESWHKRTEQEQKVSLVRYKEQPSSV